MIFYLGTSEPHWLRRTGVPLFVSARRLRGRVKRGPPQALGPWALDSGGFTELDKYGAWVTTPEQYAGEARRWMREAGNMQWAAPQDWMCEPHMLTRTGLSVEEHQRRTVASYLTLRTLAPDVPWVPVVQGWERADYLRCVSMYAAEGIDLAALPLTGLGSVCRRQGTKGAEGIVYALASRGIRLHLFGFKLDGLARCADLAASSDSMAWSYSARREGAALPGCPHRKCANCLRYALAWRERALGAAKKATEGRLFHVA